ncbi:MAG: wax ester/triacylglycerol synthase family O-acyltransferase [Solirubrobacteraceae bacterium]
MPANDQLTALDATFLELEQANDSALMHIGATFVFGPLPGGGTPAIGQLRAHLGQRLELLPRYRQKLDAPRTGGLAWPSWERDERFEIEAHVRHARLSSPGEERELLSWVSDFYSHRLDRNRPLWEMVLLDGLADGRWALVTKTHHCLVDGVGSVGVVDLLLDALPGPEEQSAPRPTQIEALEQSGHGWLPSPPAPIRQAAGTGLAAARAGAHALMHPREALERSREVLDLFVRDELIAAPRSSINVPTGTTRRIATAGVDLQELQAIRSALGGTLNDIVLCAAAGGLRELLQGRGEELPRRGLRAQVPVNIRHVESDGALGNKVSSLFIELPVAESDPLRRYELVRAAAQKRKASGQALGAGAVVGLTGLALPVLHSSLARLMYSRRLFNITITNVRGSPRRLYAFGAPALGVVPVVPLAAEHALGITALSYAGQLTFGLVADRAAVPDLHILKDGILNSIRELAALAPATTAAP